MRKSNAWRATQEAQATWELRDRFKELFEAAAAWRDHGDHDRLDMAITLLQDDAQHAGFPALDGKMPRDQRVAALAARYVTVSRFVDKVRQVADAIDAQRREIGDQIRLVTAEQGGVPTHERELLRHLRAEGIGQTDLHPVSRALGHAVAQSIREFNGRRRPAIDGALPDNYSDHPVANWEALPPIFAGVELIETPRRDKGFFEPIPLPPSTDIAAFAPDRVRPSFGEGRLDTILTWSTIIKDWAGRANEPMQGMQSVVWAPLLAHRMPADGSDLTRLNGVEVQSPWRPDHIVRVDVLKMIDEPEDDVPFC